MSIDKLPSSIVRLFWEVDPESVDLNLHGDYVIERVMARGDWEGMQWLRATYPVEVLAEFLRRKGGRLAPREYAYWALLTDLPPDAPSGGGRPSWAGQ